LPAKAEGTPSAEVPVPVLNVKPIKAAKNTINKPFFI
jgi:hypothetical protein